LFWLPPQADCVKINIDGITFGSPSCNYWSPFLRAEILTFLEVLFII